MFLFLNERNTSSFICSALRENTSNSLTPTNVGMNNRTAQSTSYLARCLMRAWEWRRGRGSGIVILSSLQKLVRGGVVGQREKDWNTGDKKMSWGQYNNKNEQEKNPGGITGVFQIKKQTSAWEETDKKLVLKLNTYTEAVLSLSLKEVSLRKKKTSVHTRCASVLWVTNTTTTGYRIPPVGCQLKLLDNRSHESFET